MSIAGGACLRMRSPSIISHSKETSLFKKIIERIKRVFLAVIRAVRNGLRKFLSVLTEENIKRAEHIVQNSMMVLSRQFWEPA